MGWYSIARYQTHCRGWAKAANIPALVKLNPESWTRLSLLTGTWVTPAKEGLDSMRFHLRSPSHFCAQCGAPINSGVLQISIAVITHFLSISFAQGSQCFTAASSLNDHNRHTEQYVTLDSQGACKPVALFYHLSVSLLITKSSEATSFRKGK